MGHWEKKWPGKMMRVAQRGQNKICIRETTPSWGRGGCVSNKGGKAENATTGVKHKKKGVK